MSGGKAVSKYIVVAEMDLNAVELDNEKNHFSWKKDSNYQIEDKSGKLSITSENGWVTVQEKHREKVLGVFSRLEEIPAVAFKSKTSPTLYLCDGPDCINNENENGDVYDLSQALIVINKTFTTLTNAEIEAFKQFMRGLRFFDWDKDIEPNYTEVHVNISQEQLNIIRERNEW